MAVRRNYWVVVSWPDRCCEVRGPYSKKIDAAYAQHAIITTRRTSFDGLRSPYWNVEYVIIVRNKDLADEIADANQLSFDFPEEEE